MRKIAAALVAASLVISGCSSSSGDDPAAALEQRVRDFSEAFFVGIPSDQVATWLTERCVKMVGADTLAQITTQAAATYPDVTVTSVEPPTIDGTVARITYHLSDPAFDQTDERWLLIDGTWLNDAC